MSLLCALDNINSLQKHNEKLQAQLWELQNKSSNKLHIMNTPDTTQTAGQTAHSPLPWTLHRKLPSSSNRYVYAADEAPVCECDSMHESLRKVEAANAAYIVLAANNHDKLVAALKDLLGLGSFACNGELANQAAIRASALLTSLQS